VKKHYKVFKVRADIIDLRTDITTAKANKTKYMDTPEDKKKIEDLKAHLNSFTSNLYEKLEQLIVNEGTSSALKSSLLS